MGAAKSTTSSSIPESKRLTSTVMAIERAILHATMIGASITDVKVQCNVTAAFNYYILAWKYIVH